LFSRREKRAHRDLNRSGWKSDDCQAIEKSFPSWRKILLLLLSLSTIQKRAIGLQMLSTGFVAFPFLLARIV
jgi:hypothetical protein